MKCDGEYDCGEGDQSDEEGCGKCLCSFSTLLHVTNLGSVIQHLFGTQRTKRVRRVIEQ